MNSRDLGVIFLYDRKSKDNAAAIAPNINAAFGNGSDNECNIRRLLHPGRLHFMIPT